MRMVCVPAETTADEVSAEMLAQAARSHEFEAEAISSKFHIGEIRASSQRKNRIGSGSAR